MTIFTRQMTLYTLIASHVNSERRLASLHKAIASALRETDQVWLSMSHDIPVTLPKDDRLVVCKCDYARCSQATHWIILCMALIGRNIHVVLLDDDDAFKEGARDVFDLYCSSRAVVKCSNNDVSGCVMHLATFYTLLKRYILTDDPTYPMADVTLLEDAIAVTDMDVVDKKPFNEEDSTWFNVITHSQSP